MKSNPVIEFDGIHKTYISDFKRARTEALVDLSFRVALGEVFGIVGPNGAGKSTALKILMGFVKYDKGAVSLSGHHPANPVSHRLIGYLPENPCLYENLSPKDHLKFAGRVSGLPAGEISKRTEKLLDLVNLSHAAGQTIRRFSKGMTQRAALAYALFHEPEILILDEPMSGLDPLGRRLVVDIIDEYHRSGHTILFCSHVLMDVERICDRIGIMNNGRLSAIITPEELKNRPAAPQERANSPLESFFMETIGNGNNSASGLVS